MLQALIALVENAGRLMTAPEDIRVTDKEGHANYVTNIDLQVETELRKGLLALLPGSEMIGEEEKNQPLTDRPTWVVDPIDGTTNFIRNRKVSAISVGLLENGQPVMACVHQPYARETFTAEKGKGAFLNGRPIHVSTLPLSEALVGMGTSPYLPQLAEPTLRLALDFLREAGDLRRCGAAAMDLADVACGRQEVFFELRLSPWDVAAGSLLIAEAGGVFAMPWESATQFAKPAAILATNAACAADARRLFDRVVPVAP